MSQVNVSEEDRFLYIVGKTTFELMGKYLYVSAELVWGDEKDEKERDKQISTAREELKKSRMGQEYVLLFIDFDTQKALPNFALGKGIHRLTYSSYEEDNGLYYCYSCSLIYPNGEEAQYTIWEFDEGEIINHYQFKAWISAIQLLLPRRSLF